MIRRPNTALNENRKSFRFTFSLENDGSHLNGWSVRFLQICFFTLCFISSSFITLTSTLAVQAQENTPLVGNVISGNVFLDYNADGHDGGYSEPGLSRIRVQAFDVENQPLGQPVVTDFEGNYEVSGLAVDQPVRLEFSVPEQLSSLRAGAAGRGSGTTVLFATAGDEEINVGFNHPGDYCQANPDTVVTAFSSAASPSGHSADVLLSIPYTATGFSRQTTPLATQSQIGAVYGLAYQRSTQVIYASAYQKRFAPFGPGGPDAIYQVSPNGTLLGMLKLSELAGIPNVAGTDVHTFRATAGEFQARDDASYKWVGKMALGDIEISDDQRTLYVVNLFDRTLYAIDITDSAPTPVGDADLSAEVQKQPSLIGRWPTPDACPQSVHRPMGLAWHEAKLWIGSVCEDASYVHVHSFNPLQDSAIEESPSQAHFSLEVTLPLSYTRETILNLPQSTGLQANWRPWSDDPTAFDYTLRNGDSSEIALPQPMLSDMEFDGAHLILGLRDRFGDQSGYRAYQVPNALGSRVKPANRLYSGDAVGDILRVCQFEGAWLPEGSKAPDGSSFGCTPAVGLVGANSMSGLNGSEYYYWDLYPASGASQWSPNDHVEQNETAQGGLLQIQGQPTILTTAAAPFSAFSGGYLRLDNQTGQRAGVGSDDLLVGMDALSVGGYLIYTASQSPGRFGQANGLGDIEALCQEAPIEIGNRVWLDLDGDGIQDPGEPGLAAVNVRLYERGEMIGIAKTTPMGDYIFGGFDGANLKDGVMLQPHHRYQLRVAFEDAAQAGGVAPTIPNVGDDSEQSDRYDSDGDRGDLRRNVSTIVVALGNPGDNNHQYDFGFVPAIYEDGVEVDDEQAAGRSEKSTATVEDNPAAPDNNEDDNDFAEVSAATSK